MARYTLIAAEGPTSAPDAVAERLLTCNVHSRTAPEAGPSSAWPPEFDVLVDGAAVRATLLDVGPPWLFSIDGKPCEVVAETAGEYRVLGGDVRLRVATGKSQRVTRATTAPCLIAPMPGRIVRVSCKPGDLVEAGTPLVVLEAMKMENELTAPARGRVAEVFVREGSAVEARAKLVRLAEP